MPGQPLPENPFSERDHSNAYKAYQLCLHVEQAMQPMRLKKDSFNIVAPRLLGYILIGLHANGRFEGRDRFAVEVHSCEDDDAVVTLAQRYKQYFVKACE